MGTSFTLSVPVTAITFVQSKSQTQDKIIADGKEKKEDISIFVQLANQMPPAHQT